MYVSQLKNPPRKQNGGLITRFWRNGLRKRVNLWMRGVLLSEMGREGFYLGKDIGKLMSLLWLMDGIDGLILFLVLRRIVMM
jgi:hypothetical protein